MKLLKNIMKFFAGLFTNDIKPTPTPVAPAAPPVNASPTTTLAWGTSYTSWDKALYSAVVAHDWTGILIGNLKVTPVEYVAQLISIMAKYESSWKPETKYEESGHLTGVTSRGLMQISVDSSNQKAYGFNVTAADLHDPLINLRVAVKIMHYQAKKHGVLFNGLKTSGAGAYWSVGRGTSGSYKKIAAYMAGF